MDAVEVMYRHFALRDFRSKGHHADEWSVCSATVEGPTMRRLRLQIIAFSLAALGVTAFDPGPAFSQTPPPPVKLAICQSKPEAKPPVICVFQPDLADVDVKNPSPQLQDAIKNASLNKCFPPRATFKVVVPSGGDELFLKTLAKARADALAAALPKLGLDKDQFRTEWELGAGEYVQVSYGPFKPDNDTDGPTLNVGSTPPHGSKVKF